nr:hypothetical protein JVH1_4548 [Rhodococcus sp. JVH1]
MTWITGPGFATRGHRRARRTHHMEACRRADKPVAETPGGTRTGHLAGLTTDELPER